MDKQSLTELEPPQPLRPPPLRPTPFLLPQMVITAASPLSVRLYVREYWN